MTCWLKRALWLAAVFLAASDTVYAQGFRWAGEFAQGTFVASILNERDSAFRIFCPSGQIDTTPSITIETSQISPGSGEQILVQVLVDGRNYPLHSIASSSSIAFEGAGRAARESVGSLVDALTRSSQRSFIVEYPKYGRSESFSLLDARRILGTGRMAILSGC